MSFIDWQQPQRGLADVPVERDTIGAMGVSGNDTGPVHFYVYRGLGFDVFEPQPPETLPRPDPVDALAVREERRVREAARAEARRLAKEKRKRERALQDLTYREHLKYLASLRQAEQESEAQTPEPPAPKADTPKPKARVKVRGKPSNPRPAPGWTPPTGGDLEEWLDLLD